MKSLAVAGEGGRRAGRRVCVPHLVVLVAVHFVHPGRRGERLGPGRGRRRRLLLLLVRVAEEGHLQRLRRLGRHHRPGRLLPARAQLLQPLALRLAHAHASLLQQRVVLLVQPVAVVVVTLAPPTPLPLLLLLVLLLAAAGGGGHERQLVCGRLGGGCWGGAGARLVLLLVLQQHAAAPPRLLHGDTGAALWIGVRFDPGPLPSRPGSSRARVQAARCNTAPLCTNALFSRRNTSLRRVQLSNNKLRMEAKATTTDCLMPS